MVESAAPPPEAAEPAVALARYVLTVVLLHATTDNASVVLGSRSRYVSITHPL